MSLKQEEGHEALFLVEEGDEVRTIGSWSFHENLLYVVFLQKNKVIMQSKRKRRNQRVFDQMSEFVVTRTSLQCRSHHQKFLQKLGDVKAIINNFKKYLTKEEYRQQYLEAVGKRKDSANRPESVVSLKLQEQSRGHQLRKFKNQLSEAEQQSLPGIKSQTESKEEEGKKSQPAQKRQKQGDKFMRSRKFDESAIVQNEIEGKPEMMERVLVPNPFMQFPFMPLQGGIESYPFLSPYFQSLRPFY